MKPFAYKNPIPVAAHRGNAKYYPENTIVSFENALTLDPDMLEIDLHMTRDHEIIMMHDHKVDRTSDGTGLIREKTLAEMKALDVGAWKGEQFRGERVPTFREFLEMLKAHRSDVLVNVELKDYPADSGDFAYESADRSIAMLQEFNMMDRICINTWSGELNEHLAEKYGPDLRIHAYHPQETMGRNQKRFVYDYAYCVCLFGTKAEPVVRKQFYDLAKAYGVEPWAYYPVDTPEVYDASIENGVMLFTSNDPKWAMDYLRAKGLHK